jgi:hypothetical protein
MKQYDFSNVELVGKIRLDWVNNKGEFGRVSIYNNDDNKIEIDSEYMSPEFLKALLFYLVEVAEIQY